VDIQRHAGPGIALSLGSVVGFMIVSAPPPAPAPTASLSFSFSLPECGDWGVGTTLEFRAVRLAREREDCFFRSRFIVSVCEQ
jgi:hypothetical protein